MLKIFMKPAYWLGGFALSLPVLMCFLTMTVVEKKFISIPVLIITLAISQLCYLIAIDLLTKPIKE